MNPTDAAARAGISQQTRQVRAGEQLSAESVDSARPGRSGAAVGQQAKAAVAAAFEAGIEVPKNAQGQAASSIARGVDPAALFAAQAETGGVTAPDVGTDDLGLAAADPGKLGTAAEELSAAGIEPAAVAYSGASAAIAPTLADGAEAALKLLQDVTA